MLKHTDWARSPIYHQYLRNGRWKHEDQSIYSEIELKYLSTTLNQMINKENTEEFNGSEGMIILEKHSAKTLHTLEILFN